jgi:hypothetical protein
MASLLYGQKTKLTQSSPSGTASGWYGSGLAAIQGYFPEFVLDGAEFFSYTVPAGKKLTIGALTYTQNAYWSTLIQANGPQEIGTVFMKVNGTIKAEFKLQDTGFANISATGGCNGHLHTGKYPISFGGGITFSAGDVISFDLNGLREGVYRVNLHVFGNVAGASTLLNFNDVVEIAVSTNKEFFTYTVPAGGYTMTGFMAVGWSWDARFIGFVKLYIAGQLCFEMNCQSQTESSACTVTTIPMQGMVLYEGQTIKMLVSDPSFFNNTYTGLLSGDLSNLSGETSTTFIG